MTLKESIGGVRLASSRTILGRWGGGARRMERLEERLGNF